MQIKSYDDFIKAMLEAGFSMGGGNDEGVFAVVPFSWNTRPDYDTPVKWHTGDGETDPWEWRMRVLDERRDIAYAKVFFKKSGYITKEWYPYFLAVRRETMDFEDAYYNGTISQEAKRIYDVINDHDCLPLHTIKQMAAFGKEDKSKFERALVELQMRMYITMCGRQQKMSNMGFEYGWASTVFCTAEKFWDDEEVFSKAGEMDKQKAIEGILEQIRKLNPRAEQKKCQKFILG